MDLLSRLKARLREIENKKIIKRGDIMHIRLSTRDKKKVKVILKDDREVHFGAKGTMTFLEGADESKRAAYRKRHEAIILNNGKKAIDEYLSPAFLSYHILW